MSQPSCLSSGVSFLLLRGPSVRGSYRNAIRVGPRIRLYLVPKFQREAESSVEKQHLCTQQSSPPQETCQ